MASDASGRTFVDRGTTFRGFVTRSVRWCASCRYAVARGCSAWKPTNGRAGWASGAILCLACGDKLGAS